MRLAPVLALLLAACSGPASEEVGWIAPFDGQTNFHPEQDLVVSLRNVVLPEGYPLSELIQVMDMLDGGRVPGHIEQTDEAIRFVPEYPWEADRRCGWTIYNPLEEAHGPEVHLAGIEGTQVFEVSDNIHALEATVGEVDGQVCLLLSRPVEESLQLTVWSEEDEFEFEASDEPDLWDEFNLAETDLGAGAKCFDTPAGLAAGDAIRVRIEGASVLLAQGPWRLELSDETLSSLLAARRRASLTPAQWESP